MVTTASEFVDSQGGTPVVLLKELVSETGQRLPAGTRGVALFGFRTPEGRRAGVMIRITRSAQGGLLACEQVVAQPTEYAITGRRIIPNPPPDPGSEVFPPKP